MFATRRQRNISRHRQLANCYETYVHNRYSPDPERAKEELVSDIDYLLDHSHYFTMCATMPISKVRVDYPILDLDEKLFESCEVQSSSLLDQLRHTARLNDEVPVDELIRTFQNIVNNERTWQTDKVIKEQLHVSGMENVTIFGTGVAIGMTAMMFLKTIKK